MEDVNFRKGDAKTEVFGSNRMLQPSPVEKIPDGPTTPEIAYQMVKDETFAQTQPRLNLATFGQLDKIYLTDLASYNHIVNQRNKLLKDLSVQPSLKDTLDIWDIQMAEYGRKIIDKRSEFIKELNETVRKIHGNLTGGLEELNVIYEPDCTAEKLESTICANRERDMRMRLTSAGPHRDDLCVMANGIDIRKYGSQGQQRTAALSLKLSEIYIVKRKIKDTPVLLLDDVLSELDSSRQNYLLDSISDIQTLITCTGLDDFISHQFQINKVFQVVQGTVSQPV